MWPPSCLLLSNLVPQEHSVEQSCPAVAHQLRHTHCAENISMLPAEEVRVQLPLDLAKGLLDASAHLPVCACQSAASWAVQGALSSLQE